MLVASEGAELVDARLDVVTGLFLTLADGFKVDLLLDLLVGGERRSGDVEAEVALGLHDGDPIFALEDHAAAGGPDGLHRRGGVAIGEDIRDVIGFHRFERVYIRRNASRQALGGTSRGRRTRPRHD